MIKIIYWILKMNKILMMYIKIIVKLRMNYISFKKQLNYHKDNNNQIINNLINLLNKMFKYLNKLIKSN